MAGAWAGDPARRPGKRREAERLLDDPATSRRFLDRARDGAYDGQLSTTRERIGRAGNANRDHHVERRAAERSRPLDGGRTPATPETPPNRSPSRSTATSSAGNATTKPRSPRATSSKSSRSSAAARGRSPRPSPRRSRSAVIPSGSRLFVGTGKYATLELMRDCLEASGPRSDGGRPPGTAF